MSDKSDQAEAAEDKQNAEAARQVEVKETAEANDDLGARLAKLERHIARFLPPDVSKD